MLDRLREKEAGRDVRQGWADPVSAASLVDIKSGQRGRGDDFKQRSERTNGLKEDLNLACVCSFSINSKLMLTITILQTFPNVRRNMKGRKSPENYNQE